MFGKYLKEYFLLFLFVVIGIVKGATIDRLNVKDYGAKGDGIVDDTKAFLNVLSRLKENQVLYIPKGKYIIKATLYLNTSNVEIVGDGAETLLQYKWPKFSIVKKVIYGFVLSDVRNVKFKNFCVDGGSSNYKQIIYDDWKKQTWDVDGAYHLFFIKPVHDNSVDNIQFTGLTLSNSFFDAIHTYGRLEEKDRKYRSNRLIITNCLFRSIGGHGVGLNNVSNARISDSKFTNVGLMKMTNTNYGSGLAVDVSAGCKDVLVEGNRVDGSGGGFKCETHHFNGSINASRNIRFINNYIKNLYVGNDYKVFYGIKMNGINCSANRNTIESYEHGILIGIDATNNVISNNNIIKTVAHDAAGIRCDKNGGGHQIVGNYIINTGAQGILIANSNNIKLINNTVGLSKLDNIRIAGGKDISITENYLFEPGGNNISIAPIGNMKISDLVIENNSFLDASNRYKSKEILLVSGLNNVTKKNNSTIVGNENLLITKPTNLAKYRDGQVVLNSNFRKEGQHTVAWKIKVINGVKKIQKIGIND